MSDVDSINRALCAPDSPTRIDPDHFYAPPGTPEANEAKALCMACDLYFKCSEYALKEGILEGIWGGLGQADRERAWKKTGGRPATFTTAYAREVGSLMRASRELHTFDDERRRTA